MDEHDLIDAINDRAATDAAFRNRLDHAVQRRSSSLIKQLIQIVLRELAGRAGKYVIEKVIDWFK